MGRVSACYGWAEDKELVAGVVGNDGNLPLPRLGMAPEARPVLYVSIHIVLPQAPLSSSSVSKRTHPKSFMCLLLLLLPHLDD